MIEYTLEPEIPEWIKILEQLNEKPNLSPGTSNCTIQNNNEK